MTGQRLPTTENSAATTVAGAAPPWRAAGLRYFGYGFFLRGRFGVPVHKVSLDAGFTCPNVDGTVARGGCVFCDNRSFSPSRRLPRATIGEQLAIGMAKVRERFGVARFLAYFQPATNTYAPVERLRPLYEEALAHSHVVGLAIGTRPDCVPDDVLDLVDQLAAQRYVSLELGLQTIHDRSLAWMNRGCTHAAFVDAMARARGRHFEIGAHVILGLPGESRDDMLATADELARAGVDSVKLHNLYVVKGTPLADDVAAGRVILQSQAEYVETAVDFIERLPPTVVVERVSGEAPPDYFVGPAWCLQKAAVRLAIDAEFRRRDSYQGCRWAQTS
ncbi:MAG: TIGR01212 family radical SAM protein [Pirellulales bacterium]|nr:TIGR01212 family radical SAM protein [Pirellulales bacterium]